MSVCRSYNKCLAVVLKAESHFAWTVSKQDSTVQNLPSYESGGQTPDSSPNA